MSSDPQFDSYSPLRVGNLDGAQFFHDKALIKAEESNHKVAKFGKARRTLFVWDLSHKTKDEQVKMFFQRYGEVRSATVIRDVVTRISKGYAFVEFERCQGAVEAEERADGTLLAGRPVRCQRKVGGGLFQGWRPRRLGGGFGGRKTSGQLRFGGKDNPFSFKSGNLTLTAEKRKSSVEEQEEEGEIEGRSGTRGGKGRAKRR